MMMNGKKTIIFIVSFILFICGCSSNNFIYKNRFNIVSPKFEEIIGNYEYTFDNMTERLELKSDSSFIISYYFGFDSTILCGKFETFEDLVLLSHDSCYCNSNINIDSLKMSDQWLLHFSNVYFIREYKNYLFLITPNMYQFAKRLLNDKEAFEKKFINRYNGYIYGKSFLTKRIEDQEQKIALKKAIELLEKQNIIQDYIIESARILDQNDSWSVWIKHKNWKNQKPRRILINVNKESGVASLLPLR